VITKDNLRTAICGDASDREASADMTSRILHRIRSEYREMPGMTLTRAQAARLWGLKIDDSERLLVKLAEDGFLVCTGSGAYRLGEDSRRD
jgi:hypothetical protein